MRTPLPPHVMDLSLIPARILQQPDTGPLLGTGTKIDSGARPKASQPRVTTPAPRTVHHIHGELDQLQHGVQSLQQTYATMSEKCDQVNSVLLSLS